MNGAVTLGTTKETYYEDVCKYPFNAISALFGAYVDVDCVRVWDFTKRSFCWVEICYPYSFSFINDHILEIHCLDNGLHYLFIDLNKSLKLTTGDIRIYHSSECLLEETADTLTVRSLDNLNTVKRQFRNPNRKIEKRMVGSRVFGADDRQVYEFTESGMQYVATLASRLVLGTQKILFMSESSFEFRNCIDTIKTNSKLKAFFADDFPYVFGAINGLEICYNVKTDHKINTEMSPFIKIIRDGKLFVMGCGQVRTIDLKTNEVTFGRFPLGIPSNHSTTGISTHFILLADRDWRYLYDIAEGRVVKEYKADNKSNL